LKNNGGIHGRTAAKFSKVIEQYDEGNVYNEVFVEKNGRKISGRDGMSLMTLDAPYGTALICTVIGNGNAELCTNALVDLVEKTFVEMDKDIPRTFSY